MNQIIVSHEQQKKARAMKCFGGLVEQVIYDPDPKAEDKLQFEFNCLNCDDWNFCVRLHRLISNAEGRIK